MANTTTVHCPDCGARVEASPDATAVACGACNTAFSPWGLPTTARSASTPPVPTPHGAADAVAGPGGGAEDDLVGAIVGGHRLLRVLGRGGMGTVYEAEDARRGRVAVKVLPAPLARDASFVSRFHREAKTLSGLSHPHLVEVYERGQDGDHCYFVMEYVRGESLRRVMERGPVGWREAVRITREVLSGLGYAHGRGVVHRDLKPENILLDADGRARLVDFGLSRIVRGEGAEDLSRLTRTNVILGTYEYMAPEQRVGAAVVDERADLFALGVILYEMLTGALPLGRFEAASRLRPGVPTSLDAVVHAALATSPKDRFPSAVAFREALDGAESASGAGASARPAAGPGPSVPSGAAAVPTEALSRMHLDAARKTLRHVEILAACDRVAGWLLVLGFFGLFGAGSLSRLRWGWEWGVWGSSIFLLIGGVLMLKQGRRLRELAPGSREAQVTASFFLLILFPPIGTALGIYGLVVLTSDAAREAFRVGKASLLSRSWLAREFVAPRPSTGTSPGNAPASFAYAAPDARAPLGRRRRLGLWRSRELLDHPYHPPYQPYRPGTELSPVARRVATWVLIVPVALVLMVQARSVPTYALIAFGTWFMAYFVLGGTRGTVLPLVTVVALGLALLWLVASPADRAQPAWLDAPPSPARLSPSLPPAPPPRLPPVPDGAWSDAHEGAPSMGHR